MIKAEQLLSLHQVALVGLHAGMAENSFIQRNKNNSSWGGSPCRNPVLRTCTIMIISNYYKGGSTCQEWRVLMKRNGGYSWSGIYTQSKRQILSSQQMKSARRS